MQAAANPRKLLFALLLTMLISSQLVQSSNSVSSPSPSSSPSLASISRPSGSMAIFENSVPKIATSPGGYVLEDVPHLVDYISDVPTDPNPLQDNPSYSVVKQCFVNVDDTVAQKVPELAIDTSVRIEITEVGSMPMTLQLGSAGSSGGGAGYRG
ncbi:hypothetical protein ACFX12_033850 [Malus domestica]